MDEHQQLVAETAFSVTWPVPSYPGARFIDCGASIAALYCYKVSASSMLVYGKMELIGCYQNIKEQGRYHFTNITRYLNQNVMLERGQDLASPARANLVQGLDCKLDAGGGQEKVTVTGTIQVRMPVPTEPTPMPSPRRAPFLPRGSERLPSRSWAVSERG